MPRLPNKLRSRTQKSRLSPSRKRNRRARARLEELECRRVLATAAADVFTISENNNLDIPNGASDLLFNDATAEFVTAVSVSSANSNAFYAIDNLIQGSATGFQASPPHDQLGNADVANSRWVTDAPGGSADYYTVADAPIITLDLGSDVPLSEISTWGYDSGNSNGVRDFELAFATEAEGTGGFGTSISYNPSFTMAINDVPRQSFDFTEEVTARYVQFTATDNYAGTIAGGDRVGLGEIAFQSLVVSQFDATSTKGATVSVNSDGSFSYDHTTAGIFDSLNTGDTDTDTFSYTISDGVTTDTATVTITINGSNETPIAADDSLATDEATPVNFSGLTPPVALFPLDEMGGTIAADVVGGNDATISGGVTLGEPGATPNTGTSFDFNVGRVEAPYDPALNPDGSFTVEAWAKVEGGQGGFRAAFSARDGNTNADRRGIIIYASNTNNWEFWTGPGVADWDKLIGPAIEVGEWTHLVATFETAGGPDAGGTYTGTKTLYINGQQAAQANQRYEPNQDLSTRIGFGANESAGGDFFADGDLDNIAIYDQALSPVEIAARFRDRAGVLVNDTSEEFPFNVSAVNGDNSAVGSSAVLPSGATVNVGAQGQVFYDPNGAFEAVSVGSTATDSFSYTITEQPSLLEGLVAQYRLDGDATDSSGNGHNGTITGTTTVPGIIDDALQFNGSSDKIDIPFSNELNPAGSFSLSIWARVEGGTGHRSPLTSRDDTGGDQGGFIIYANPANQWQFWTGANGGGWDMLGNPAVVNNQWVHLTATFEASGGPDASGTYAGTKSLYIDGALAASAAGAYKPNPQELLRIGAGASEGPGDFFFNGDIDDVSLWNRSLTDTEVDQVYQLGQASESVSDLEAQTDTATVTVTINGLNDAPTAVDDTVTTTEDSLIGAETFSTDAADAAAINAAYPQLDAGTTDASISGGVLSINTGLPATNGTVVVEVNADATAGADRTIELDVGADTPNPGSYNVGIQIGENPIVFHPGLGGGTRGAFRVQGPGGFGNTDMGFVPAAGTLHHFEIQENATTGEFTITVTDGDNPANVFTTSFTNPASVGGDIFLRRSGPNNGPALFDNVFVGTSLLDNDTDVDSDDTLQAVPGMTTSMQGVAVTINASGTYSYDAGDMFQSLPEGATATDSFTYSIDDGNGGTSSATVNLTINGLNDAPLAGPVDGGMTDQNTVLNGTGLDANITDVDTGDTPMLQATTGTSTGGASFAINTDGSFSYDPGSAFQSLDVGETAVDTFTYTAVDAAGATGTGTVSVTVTGLDDAVVVAGKTGRTDQDTPLTSVVSYLETFDTDAADAAAIDAAYQRLSAAGIDASVVGGVLQINTGTANLGVALSGGTDRTITLDVGADTTDPGSFNVGFSIGQNNIVFHPGFAAIPGAFRVEGPGGFGNTDLGFVPPIGPLHTMKIVENTATGEFTITITDGSNPNNVYTQSFTNAASVGGDLSFRRGGNDTGPALYDNLLVMTASLLANDADPDGGALTISPASTTSTAGAAVTINADGTFSYDPGTLFQSLTSGETATDTFSYMVADANSTDTATVTVTIDGLNDAPTNVDAGGPYTVAEGGSLTLSGSFTDPDTNDTRTINWDLNGDGDFSDATGTNPTLSWSSLQALAPPIDNGPATLDVTFQVDDGTGPVTDTATLTVTNTAPTVAVDALATALLGASVDFTLTPFDPSDADTAAGFSYSINWGDGSSVETVPVTTANPVVVSHSFAAPGVVTVEVTITDQDGGMSSTTQEIEIVPVAIDGNNLVATGTPSSDRIIFYSAGAGVQVRYNNLTYPSDGSSFSVPSGGQIVANGMAGSDQIIVSGTLGASVVFNGGEGNDYLAGGTTDDTLNGGAGNDVILAGEGDNFVDGGDDNDRIEGREGDDLLFGGAGNDRLNGRGGNDILDGGDGNDFLFGGLGDDLLAGRSGADTINGSFGNDLLFGGSQSDQLFGSDGNDLLIGGSGGDRVRGDGGDDLVVGGTSALQADLEASLDALLAGGSLMANVQSAVDAWFSSQDETSRGLFEAFADDGTADELTGGSGVDTFVAGSNDSSRDVRSDDTEL